MEPRIAEGVAVMAAHKDRSLALRMEDAMAQAVKDSYAAGVIDPVVVKEKILEARRKVLYAAGFTPAEDVK